PGHAASRKLSSKAMENRKGAKDAKKKIPSISRSRRRYRFVNTATRSSFLLLCALCAFAVLFFCGFALRRLRIRGRFFQKLDNLENAFLADLSTISGHDGRVSR